MSGFQEFFLMNSSYKGGSGKSTGSAKASQFVYKRPFFRIFVHKTFKKQRDFKY